MEADTQLDHVVINVAKEMDLGEKLFNNLGFTLTSRGYHTLGSINHLMIFKTDYLELIGMPIDAEMERLEITSKPLGLNGLVFKTDNVDATYAHLKEIGMAGDPPKAFSRPVQVKDKFTDAKFRTVTVREDVFPWGRVYFCEHATPHLVWQQESGYHSNGSTEIAEFISVHNEPYSEAERYSKLLKIESDPNNSAKISIGKANLTILSPKEFGERYKTLLVNFAAPGPNFFGALVLRSVEPSNTAVGIKENPNCFYQQDTKDGLAILVEPCNTILEFIKGDLFTS